MKNCKFELQESKVTNELKIGNLRKFISQYTHTNARAHAHTNMSTHAYL